MTILITGARGAVGAGLARRLPGRGLAVRVASRAPEKLDLPAIRLDLADPASFAPALAGVTGVFLYAEPAGIEEFLATAVRAGVERVVVLSSSAAAEPDGENDPLARQHLAVERAVLAAPVKSVLLRPGAFASNALGWAAAIRAGEPVEQAYPDARTAPIHPADIVDVAELALTTDKLDGQAIFLGGPEALSFRDQVRILGEVLGRRIELRELTRDEAVETMGRYMPAPVVESLLNYWSGALTGLAGADDSAERITGHRARTFRQWAEEHRAAFGD